LDGQGGDELGRDKGDLDGLRIMEVFGRDRGDLDGPEGKE